MRDYQRKRFYTLFHTKISSMPFNTLLADVEEVKNLVEDTLNQPNIKKNYDIEDLAIDVRLGKSSRLVVHETRPAEKNSLEYIMEGSNRPTWVGIPVQITLQIAYLKKVTAYQLLSFALARRNRTQQGQEMAWHGWQYMRALLDIIDVAESPAIRKEIEVFFRESKIVYSDPVDERTERNPSVDAKAAERLNIEFSTPHVFWAAVGEKGWVSSASNTNKMLFTKNPEEVKIWKKQSQVESYIQTSDRGQNLKLCEAPKLDFSSPEVNTASHVLWTLNPEKTSSKMFESPAEEYFFMNLLTPSRFGGFHEVIAERRWKEFKSKNPDFRFNVDNYLKICNQYRINATAFTHICSLIIPESSEELESWMKYRLFSIPEAETSNIKNEIKQFFATRAVITRKVSPEILGFWVQYQKIKGTGWLRQRYDCDFNGSALKKELMKRSDKETYNLLRSDFLPFPFLPVSETDRVIKEWGREEKWAPKYAPYKNKNTAGTKMRYGLWLPPIKGEFPFRTAVKIWKNHCDDPKKSWSTIILSAYQK